MSKTIKTSRFPRLVSEARRQKGITQSELAEIISCKQSAISMFERGNLQALAPEKQAALATYFSLPWPLEEVPEVAGHAVEPAPCFCPHFDCPANLPYQTAGRLLAMPRQQALGPGKYCRYCGEVCETRCPSCKAPYQPGACCTSCGAPYIQIPELLGAPSNHENWLADQRRLIAQLSHA